MTFDLDRLGAAIFEDRELAASLGNLTARVRMEVSRQAFEVAVVDGKVRAVESAGGAADLVISAPDSFWQDTLVPVPGYAALSLTAGGATFAGDFAGLVTPYYPAWERLLVLLRQTVCGESPNRAATRERRETDDAVGRYAYVRNGDQEARIYYEEAGEGDIALVLQATAGADSRQWRHMLSYPELRRRFRMIAYDLPGHGKSLPPISDRWWETGYQPSRETLMGWPAGLVQELGLDRPIFMGCSVGGQLALDLAAWHADKFRAFVSLNGWCRSSPGMKAFNNAPFRDPAISTSYLAGRVLATTSPLAPERNRQETSWIYKSNAHGVYAGDNDYFMNAHDLTVEGWRIDTARTPLFAVAGEFDRTSTSPEDGAAAIPEHVKGAQYRLLPGLGHFAPSDDPEAFCEAMTPILDEVLAACDACKGAVS